MTVTGRRMGRRMVTGARKLTGARVMRHHASRTPQLLLPRLRRILLLPRERVIPVQRCIPKPPGMKTRTHQRRSQAITQVTVLTDPLHAADGWALRVSHISRGRL
jgi:hypothetical protein